MPLWILGIFIQRWAFIQNSCYSWDTLKFKPIIGFDDGKLEMFAKARGTQKATAKIIDLIHKMVKWT